MRRPGGPIPGAIPGSKSAIRFYASPSPPGAFWCAPSFVLMNAPSHELPGLRVSVDRVVHHTDPGFPPDRPHAFIYFLTITNDSDRSVTLLGRKWIIREGGETLVVEGDGIVGETPALSPGESFSYNSYHLAAGDSDAHGAFHGRDAEGNAVFTRIPQFSMRVPKTL